jgi:hypothetical protein
MDENEMVCGSSIVDKARLLMEWAPLLAQLELVAIAKTPQEKAVAIIGALRIAANKTTTEKDNNVLDRAEAILKTPEGAALVDWFIMFAKEVK